jgi:hypothetical protein
VWVDNVNRGDGGATQKASASFGVRDWTLYQNGGGELIWSLGAPGLSPSWAPGQWTC